jgi:subtilase family protein/Big-like domain-containing protein
VRPKHHLKELDVHICELPDGIDERKIKRLLKKDHRLKNVELDRIVTLDRTITDPSFSRSWALPKIEAPTAWDISTGDGVIVAVLDTGVDITHPDLAANMLPGWNMFDNNDDTADVHNHGTWVAGTIAAAANNGAGSAGVAWSAEIMPVRISTPDGTAFISTIADGIRWAADHGAKVVNNSYSGVAGSAAIRSAAQYLRNKGGVLVVSAGNTGSRLNHSPSDVILVASATDSSDQRPSWSSYGPYVDIAAPGVSIFTTSRGGGYSFVSGTSFSSPIVAATAALMFSANHELTPADLDQLMLSTTTDLGAPGFDDFYGTGRVDAAAAVIAASTVIGIDDQAPSVAIISPNGGEVTGIVPVDVEASDNVGVVRAELWVNGKIMVTDTLAPFAFAWDTSNLAQGDYTLTVHAFDAAGNQGTSQNVLVTVDNSSVIDDEAPAISISAPTSGGEVSGIVDVTINATDNVVVARVALFANGQQILTSDQSPFALVWDTTLLPDGSYNLTAHAFDEADNEGISSAVSVIVQNNSSVIDDEAPAISISAPTSGEVSGTVDVTINATDNVAVARVALFANGQQIFTSDQSPFAFSWDTTLLPDGSYNLTAHAFDEADNEGVSSTVTVTVRNSAAEDTTPPEITHFNLVDGMRVARRQRVRAIATDDENVVEMRLIINGTVVAVSNDSRLSVRWRTRRGTNYVVTIEAVDQADNITSKTVNVHT